MIHPFIAIIGAGNMGSSLIGGLINHGHPADKLLAADTDESKLARLRDIFHIQTTTNNQQAANLADVIILAIKPNHLSGVTKELASIVQAKKSLVLSIAAGVRETSIQRWLGGKAAIVRAMPNTPALIKCGATGLYANEFVSRAQHDMAQSILRAVGIVVWLPDEQSLDTVTALSGSGPAYFFLIMEALEQSAKELGLNEEVARLLTLQTALGATRMAIESGTHLQTLRQQVTSPGGTTEQAIAVLEKNDIKGILKHAVQAAKLRSEELATLLDTD